MKVSGNLYAARKTAVGIVFPSAPLPVDVWRSMLRVAARDNSTSRWQLGDLLNHGEAAGYGATYDAAIAETGLSYQTTANIKTIAKRIEISRRRESLSFGHHAEVAAIPPAEQDRLLDLASHAGWSRSALREEASKFRTRTDGEGDNGAAADSFRPPTKTVPIQRVALPVPPPRTIRLQVEEHTIPLKLPDRQTTSVPPNTFEVSKSRLYEPPKLSLAETIRENLSLSDRTRHHPQTAKVIAAINEMKAEFEQEKPVKQAEGGTPTLH